jgi:hypothetical protein
MLPMFCGLGCAITTNQCGQADSEEVQALFASCPSASYTCGAPMVMPLPDGTTQCCWQDCCPGGRPLLIAGGARLAPLARRAGWASASESRR